MKSPSTFVPLSVLSITIGLAGCDVDEPQGPIDEAVLLESDLADDLDAFEDEDELFIDSVGVESTDEEFPSEGVAAEFAAEGAEAQMWGWTPVYDPPPPAMYGDVCEGGQWYEPLNFRPYAEQRADCEADCDSCGPGLEPYPNNLVGFFPYPGWNYMCLCRTDYTSWN